LLYLLFVTNILTDILSETYLLKWVTKEGRDSMEKCPNLYLFSSACTRENSRTLCLGEFW